MIPDFESTATAFFQAAKEGSTAELKKSLEAGLSVDVKNTLGETALHLAAARDRISAVAFLLDAGASADVPCSSILQYTPFMWACALGRAEIVSLLLPHVDVGRIDRVGETGPAKAVRYGHKYVTEVIRSYRARAAAMDLLQACSPAQVCPEPQRAV